MTEEKKTAYRNVRIHFRVTPSEKKRICQKMDELGIRTMSAYLRKMALDGYCVQLDYDSPKQITSLLRRCSNNLNQMAKRANETGSIYAADIEDLQTRLDEIWETQKESLKALTAIMQLLSYKTSFRCRTGSTDSNDSSVSFHSNHTPDLPEKKLCQFV